MIIQQQPDAIPKKPRIKLNSTPKAANGTSTPKSTKEPKEPKSVKEKKPKKAAAKAKDATPAAPAQPELTPEEKRARKEASCPPHTRNNFRSCI